MTILLTTRVLFVVCTLFDIYLLVIQVLFNKETEAIIGVHIIGLHAADLIQECSNAVAAGTTVRELAMMVRRLPLWHLYYTYQAWAKFGRSKHYKKVNFVMCVVKSDILTVK